MSDKDEFQKRIDAKVAEFEAGLRKRYHLPGQHDQESHGNWFHGSHEDVQQFITRPVESIDSFGTWVTSDAGKARELYGPKVKEVAAKDNLLVAHTDNFDDFFYSNKNLFQKLFPGEQVSALQKFKGKGLAKADPKLNAMRKTYLTAFKQMLQDSGYNGVVWRNSRIDLRKGDAPHDVAVLF